MKKYRLLFIMLGSAVLGLVVGRYLVPLLPVPPLLAGPTSGPEKLLKAGVVLVAIWAALANHELGHLLAGLGQGFRFALFVAGPLGIRRHPRTNRVQVYLNRDLALAGGVAATTPTRPSPRLRYQLAAVCAAGPLTSLLTGAGALAVGWHRLHSSTALPTAGARAGVVFLLVFGLLSGLLFLATTLPTRTGPFFTDRGRFFRLVGGGPAAAIEQAQLELLAHTQSGRPYASLNPEQLALLLTDSQDFVRSFAHMLAYYRCFDRAEGPAALNHIRAADQLATGQAQLFRVEIWKELAFAEAFVARDLATAEQAWHRIRPALRNIPTAQHHLTRAALALAGQDPAEALRLAAAGRELLPPVPTKSEDTFRAGLLELVAQTAARESALAPQPH